MATTKESQLIRFMCDDFEEMQGAILGYVFEGRLYDESVTDPEVRRHLQTAVDACNNALKALHRGMRYCDRRLGQDSGSTQWLKRAQNHKKWRRRIREEAQQERARSVAASAPCVCGKGGAK